MPLVPSYIENLENYVPGKPIEEVQRELGLDHIDKLASNENPIGPSPKAVNEIKNKGEFVVIVEGNKDNLVKDSEILRINKILTETVSSKDAVLLTAKITKRKKNEIYKLVHKNHKLGQ